MVRETTALASAIALPLGMATVGWAVTSFKISGSVRLDAGYISGHDIGRRQNSPDRVLSRKSGKHL